MNAVEKLDKIVADAYKQHGLSVTPTFPRVLVRLLPREQQTKGGIVLPDGSQNKPVHEGVVLKTYEPFWQTAYNRDKWLVTRSPQVILDEKNELWKIWQESAAQPGDHVIFPHIAFGIMPVEPLDGGKGDYRMVPEGEILGILKYGEPLKEWFSGVLGEVLRTSNGQLFDEVAEKILDKAEVIRKDLVSKTVSGA